MAKRLFGGSATKLLFFHNIFWNMQYSTYLSDSCAGTWKTHTWHLPWSEYRDIVLEDPWHIQNCCLVWTLAHASEVHPFLDEGHLLFGIVPQSRALLLPWHSKRPHGYCLVQFRPLFSVLRINDDIKTVLEYWFASFKKENTTGN